MLVEGPGSCVWLLPFPSTWAFPLVSDPTQPAVSAVETKGGCGQTCIVHGALTRHLSLPCPLPDAKGQLVTTELERAEKLEFRATFHSAQSGSGFFLGPLRAETPPAASASWCPSPPALGASLSFAVKMKDPLFVRPLYLFFVAIVR